MKVQVVNVKLTKAYDEYIGRTCYGHEGSVWQNPYKVGSSVKREQAVELFRRLFYSDQYAHKRRMLWEAYCRFRESEPKEPWRLACWCVDHHGIGTCHGKVLADYIERRDA